MAVCPWVRKLPRRAEGQGESGGKENKILGWGYIGVRLSKRLTFSSSLEPTSVLGQHLPGFLQWDKQGARVSGMEGAAKRPHAAD